MAIGGTVDDGPFQDIVALDFPDETDTDIVISSTHCVATLTATGNEFTLTEFSLAACSGFPSFEDRAFDVYNVQEDFNDVLQVIFAEVPVGGDPLILENCAAFHPSVTFVGLTSGATFTTPAVASRNASDAWSDTGQNDTNGKDILFSGQRLPVTNGGARFIWVVVWSNGTMPFTLGEDVSVSVSGATSDWPDLSELTAKTNTLTVPAELAEEFSNTAGSEQLSVGNWTLATTNTRVIAALRPEADYGTAVPFDPLNVTFADPTQSFELTVTDTGAAYGEDENGLQWYAVRDTVNTDANEGCLTLWAWDPIIDEDDGLTTYLWRINISGQLSVPFSGSGNGVVRT